MTSVIIGISSGLLIILLFGILKHMDKKLIYGLILSGIGFLYVGFSWTDTPSLMLTALQAIVFLLIAYIPELITLFSQDLVSINIVEVGCLNHSVILNTQRYMRSQEL